jgi:hypothetical protein
MRRLFTGLIATVLILSACSDTPTAGPVTIETEIDFSGRSYHGTFEVTVGADVLGCSSGTFVDTPGIPEKTNKVMTCESGSNTGTFTIRFDPPDGRDWRVLESSDDFAGLQGEGDFSWVQYPSTKSGEETLTGDIEYTS